MKVNQAQSLVSLPGGEPWKKEMAAAWAIYFMGTNALPALPALTNMLFHTNALVSCTTALAGIGSDAVPALLRATTSQDFTIRLAALSGLSLERARQEQVVPVVMERLADSNMLVRVEAIQCLGELHLFPQLVVPALITNSDSQDTLVRMATFAALSKFGTNAASALPKVLAACKDPNQDVREAAQYALSQIQSDPQSRKPANQ